MIGRLLSGRYEVLERLGGGGMAVVYKALDTALHRQVSVKVLRSQYADDEEFVRRFRREALAVASLSHPNIVSIYDVGQDGDTYYLVMEYIEGETLCDLIKRTGPMPASEAVTIAVQILEGLRHAHRHRIIHRDIKPHNILIKQDGHVKVTDFGIALAANTGMTIVHTGKIIGSAHYLAPEQARGAPGDERTDLYSVGVVLFEMLTGQRPYDGDTALTIAMQHLEKPVPDVRSVNPDVPVELEMIVKKAMSKQPYERYESAAKFVEDLLAWQRGTPRQFTKAIGSPRQVDLEETTIWDGFDLESEVDEEEERHRDKQDTHGAGKKIIWAALALLFMSIIVTTAFLGVRSWLHVPTVEVPVVTGMLLSEAKAELLRYGLEAQVAEELFSDEEAGVVLEQDPAGGVEVRRNRLIYLTVSKGKETTVIPDVLGKHRLEARSMLVNEGLHVEEIEEFSEAAAPDYVIHVSPPQGTQVEKDTTVQLLISKGVEPKPFAMPALVGQPFAAARDAILDLGLVLGEMSKSGSSSYPENTVIEQRPRAGTEVQVGDIVDLTLSGGCEHQSEETIHVTGKGVRVQVELFDDAGSRIIYDQQRDDGSFPLVFCWQGNAARYFVKENGETMYNRILRDGDD